MSSLLEYKRKFRVPGDTEKWCSDFEKKCEKKYGRDHTHGSLPCKGKFRYYLIENGKRINYYGRDESKCPFGAGKPAMYIVSEMEDGTWRCSCPAWKFRRKRCHHIDKAKWNPDKYEIAKEFTGRTAEALDRVFK